MSILPTPSLSATITTPTGTSRWGAVVVAGYTPPKREYLEDPSEFGEKKRRKRVVCQRCGVEGHNKSNRKHHPSPL